MTRPTTPQPSAPAARTAWFEAGIPFLSACAFFLLSSVGLSVPQAAAADPVLETGNAMSGFGGAMPTSFSASSLPSAVEAVEMETPAPKARPRAAEGFNVSLFAKGLDRPREIVTAPNGDVFISQMGTGGIVLLRDTDGDGVSDVQTNFASGFRQPSGLAVRPEGLYVADMRAVWRLTYKEGSTAADERMMVTRANTLGNTLSRPMHSLTFSPDGEHFYVSVGSQEDVAEEKLPHASIQKFRTDGGAQTTYASGLRYPTALAFGPDTGHLYAVVNERDSIAKDTVHDFFTRIRKGGFYGWPYAYNGDTPDPQFGDLRPDLVNDTITPDVLLPPHSSPTGLHFHSGTGFPKSHRHDAFVVLHGSRDTSRPIGYKVLRIRFKNGKPRDAENFLTGFWRTEQGRTEILGRPYAIAEAPDGALLVSDDFAQVIWRITWNGAKKDSAIAATGGKASALGQ